MWAASVALKMVCSCCPATPFANADDGTWMVIVFGAPPACCAGTVICTGTRLVGSMVDAGAPVVKS